jgi:hypothetical protein
VGVEPAAWAAGTDNVAQEQFVDEPSETEEHDEPAGDDWPTDDDEEDFVIVD